MAQCSKTMIPATKKLKFQRTTKPTQQKTMQSSSKAETTEEQDNLPANPSITPEKDQLSKATIKTN
eukprot:5610994-Ditylum_brightwellii.AAC.1